MSNRFVPTLAVVGAILAAILAGVLLLAEARAGGGPGVEAKSMAQVIGILVGAPVAMFLLVLWSCGYYRSRGR